MLEFNALDWHFICWFPSLYILDYLVPPPPYLKILDPPLVSFQKSVISYISWCFYWMELHADHKQVICIGLLILISSNKLRIFFNYMYVPESLKMAQNCSRGILIPKKKSGSLLHPPPAPRCLGVFLTLYFLTDNPLVWLGLIVGFQQCYDLLYHKIFFFS